MMSHCFRAGTVLLCLALALGALPGGEARAQDRLQVMTSTSILADIAANVAGDAADVVSLIPLAADPHTYTPAPQDLVRLAQADLILIVGANLEESLIEAIRGAAPDLPLVTASACVDILPFGGALEDGAPEERVAAAQDSAIAAQCAAHQAELEAGGAPPPPAEGRLGPLYTLDCGGHEEEGGGEAHGVCDPHVWTDPYNAMLWALMIRDALSERDPANAAVYAANAAAYIDALRALVRDEIAPLLATIPAENRVLVTNHLAFNYYASAFGLEVLGTIIPGASTLAEPSAAGIARLIADIRAAGVPAVFAETTANPALAEQIARESGASFHTLYTGSLSEPDGPAATYLDYLRHNTQVIAAALGGTPD